MRFDSTLRSVEDAAADAVAAEAAGHSGVFTGEFNADPFLPLALAAAATSRIEVGTSIAVAFARSPMTLAYTAWDLQRLSRGRLVLGLGSQVRAHVERRFGMPWGRPAAQMRDYVGALRAIWTAWADGTPLAFESEHYSFSLMPPDMAPVRHDAGPPPIHVAGVGEAMTRVAGEVADGFVCHAFTTPRWLRKRTLPSLLAARGSLDGFTVKAAVFAATGTDEQIASAVARFRRQIAFYASTPAYRDVLDLHGWGALGDEARALTRAGRWDDLPGLVDDEVLHAFAVVAAPSDLDAALDERFGGAVDRVSLITS